ncbi:MAG: M23 family metallopeptidase [Rhodospirillales bacterium]|jgi:murein DD-endopeptidase MepM/ murein hydrolase activator NlpD|nr:M23 family metallopeptidase [Rhodospirillales bacterium]
MSTILRGLLAVVVLAAGVGMSARLLLTDVPPATDTQAPSTLALAPLSLGNPAAAAALKVRHPDTPLGQVSIPGIPPSYGYPLRVAAGDTLAGLLVGAGVSRDEAHGAVTALGKLFDARRIRPGQDITVRFRPAPDGARDDLFLGFTLDVDYRRRIAVARTAADGFRASEEERALSRSLARAAGTIEANLFDDATAAGVPAAVLVAVVRAYSWDVDFQRAIRRGDRFEILFERFHDETGALVHAGGFVFADLALSGEHHPIYRHHTKDGLTDYFDPRGHSARKALLLTPIDGARLSSRYGKRRHPILGYTKMHRGLDFAAASGTPIYAGGDGTIEVAGTNGAYGRYIRIRHNATYSTAYGHMRRFARGMRRGKRVKQGQVIGYVGTTGRSTGPHLHYEILSGGRQVNPLKVKMPSGRKLKGAELARFQETRSRIKSELAALATNTDFAQGD